MSEKKVKYIELKKFLLEKKITRKDLAIILGIDKSTVSSKLNSPKSEFTLPEMRILCKNFKLDANKFFLNI